MGICRVGLGHSLVGLRFFVSTFLPFFLWLFSSSFSSVHAESVHGYIIHTQESRKSSRWTLTEWLRIKERMKLMDVYLAMFSNPEKESLSPEFSLSYKKEIGQIALKMPIFSESSEELKLDALKREGEAILGQIWLSNLISKTFGVRTLNIDLGVESYLEQHDLTSSSVSLATDGSFQPSTNLSDQAIGQVSTRYNSLDFRLFGKNIQDSSLVFKVGEYVYHEPEWLASSETQGSSIYKGRLYGIDLQLYLSRWLGFEGSHTVLQKSQFKMAHRESSRSDYGLYIEISLLRLKAGAFSSDTMKVDLDTGEKSSEKILGTYTGLELNF